MRTVLAKTVEGRDLAVFDNFHLVSSRSRLSPSASLTLFIGGTHGDERATVPILESFGRDYLETGKVTTPTAIISLLNPDGYAQNSRYNARGVDLNRNFPHQWSAESKEPAGPRPLSEPEAQFLHKFILEHRPAKIVSLHWALAEIDADGPQSTDLARSMWDALSPQAQLPYRLRVHEVGASTGGFCSGSLGQWCGHGLVYPDNRRPAMVTLELPYHPHRLPRPEQLPTEHVDTVKSHWVSDEENYLAGVAGSVHELLRAACAFEHDFLAGSA
jgi:murein peptide amidase A